MVGEWPNCGYMAVEDALADYGCSLLFFDCILGACFLSFELDLEPMDCEAFLLPEVAGGSVCCGGALDGFDEDYCM